jgi:hypothetical protein
MKTSRPRRLALIVFLLCLAAGFIAWVTTTVASRILVDSTGKQFTKIKIATDASLDLGELPMNAIALSDTSEPMALKMLDAPRVTIQRGLRLPTITAVWLQKTNVPDDLADSPPLLQQLTVFDCSIADETLLKLTDSSALTVLDLATDPTLTAKAVSTVMNRHELTHLGLAGLSGLDSSQFEVTAASTRRLRSLHLNGRTIDDAVLRQLAVGGQLSALQIDNTAITEDGIAFAIQNNAALGNVVISNCPISTSTIKSMKGLARLHNLTVSHIAASPAEIKQLRAELFEDLPYTRITLIRAYE